MGRHKHCVKQILSLETYQEDLEREKSWVIEDTELIGQEIQKNVKQQPQGRLLIRRLI